MIKIKNGTLYQWDINRIVEIEDPQQLITEIHITNSNEAQALSVPFERSGKKLTCRIPNILLQQKGKILIFAISASDETRITGYADFCIVERPIPANYVYTESEVLTYKALEDKLDEVIANLEVNPKDISKAVEDYIIENPLHVPEKGVDYYTEEDKNALVNDILSSLPTWEGGRY